MKKIGLWIGLIFTFFSSVEVVEASDRYYEIIDYDVVVEIEADGSALFTEKITYDFDGAFNGVNYRLDVRGIEAPTNLSVFLQGEDEETPTEMDAENSQEPGTYQAQMEGDYVAFTVYQPIEDAEQTVIYSYRLPEIITNYNDTAELNRKIIGAGWTDPLEDIDITITLPTPVSDGELQAWAHGERTGNVEVEDNQKVTLTLDQNPPNQFVEARVLFPTSVTPNNPNVVNEDKYEEIVTYEARLAGEKQKSNRTMFAVAVGFSLVGPLVSILVYIWLVTKTRAANPNPTEGPDYLYEPPAAIPPAVMNVAVFGRTPSHADVSATLMNLVRKGYLQMEEVPKKKDYVITKGKKADETLMEHEELFIDWFIHVAGNGERVTFSDIERLHRHEKKAQRFYKKWSDWRIAVIQDAQPYVERYLAKHAKKATIWVVLSVVVNLVFLGISIASVLTTEVTRLVFLLPAMGVIVTALLLRYYLKHPTLTSEGDRAQKEWAAFGRMLKEVDHFTMSDIASVELWDEYLVYAIAFGTADEVMEQMRIQYPEEEIRASSFGSYYYYNPYYLSTIDNQIKNGIQSTTPSSHSNSSGSGGGFSGGSSGGSGGGSGGGAF